MVVNTTRFFVTIQRKIEKVEKRLDRVFLSKPEIQIYNQLAYIDHQGAW